MAMHTAQPSRKTLLAAWALMMALSLGTILAGRVTLDAPLGALFMLALLALTLVKAMAILRVYLNLRAAPAGWTAGFLAYLVLLLTVVLLLYLIGLGR
jgi:hypothetical protein